MSDNMDMPWDEEDYVPSFAQTESPETQLAVMAHSFFQEKILLAAGIAERATQLKLAGVVTRDNYDQAKIITGLARKANGEIDRNKKIANAKALAWQKAINKRAGELKLEVADVAAPYLAGIKMIDDEDAKIKREAAEAAQKAARAEEETKMAAQAEANRVEREQLALERAKIDAERKEAEEAMRGERERLQAELDARMAKERAEQAERDRIADEAREVERRELAKFREEKAAAEKVERDRQAAEAARLKREAMAPDIDKVRAFGELIASCSGKFDRVTSPEAIAAIERAVKRLTTTSNDLISFGI